MPPWIGASLVASGLIAAHYLFLRAASGRVDDTLGALILEGTATLGIALSYTLSSRSEPPSLTRPGVVFAALAGLCISGASILLFSALRRGGPVAATGTIVLGGGV